jgi:hypothetical protein
MNFIEMIMQRNEEFVQEGHSANLKIMPTFPLERSKSSCHQVGCAWKTKESTHNRNLRRLSYRFSSSRNRAEA